MLDLLSYPDRAGFKESPMTVSWYVWDGAANKTEFWIVDRPR